MVPITPHQLYEFAYQAGLRGQESATCPKSYRGYVIPEMFEDGELAFGVWRKGYLEGLQQLCTDTVEGEERWRDWNG